MKKKLLLLPALCFIFSCNIPQKQTEVTIEKELTELSYPETITFPSLDSLPVTANLYHLADTAPVIVLCHQARFNKSEYVLIAKTLHEKGYNCLAIDQRSGGPLVEWFNETNLKAKEFGKAVDYLDAEQDIIAAVNFAADKYKQKVILWGSSYSSALALYIGMQNDQVAAVIAFSPGDYFSKEKGSLTEQLAGFNKPMYITSSKEEATEISQLLAKMKLNAKQMQFIPQSEGKHGSRALWKTDDNNEEYWSSIEKFLALLKS
jgi:dienelactone hydrolase